MYSDSACTVAASTGTAEAITTPGTLPDSDPVTLTAGTYYWQASYSGDASNGPSTSTCGTAGEMETVAPPTPSDIAVATSLSGGGQSGTSISVPAGTAVTDTATLSGTNASTATGTVTYDVYSDSACTVAVSSGTAEAITTPGTLPDSDPVTLTAGTYYWQASYSSDASNGPSTSTCGTAGEVETVASPLSCADTYQTVVTEHAGALTLPQLDTDTVTVKWCTDGNGHFQILSSSQAPAVQQAGFFSISGQQIGVLNGHGITFGITPTAAPAPAIDNEDLSGPSATASGLSFSGSFNAATLLAAIAADYVTKGLAAELVRYIRTGELGLISIEALKWWGQQVVTPAISYLTSHYVPGLVARWVTGQPVSALEKVLSGLAGKFAALVTQSLEALGGNATLKSVINAIQSAIQQTASAVTYTLPLWAPQISVTIDGNPVPPVSNTGTQTAFFINVQDPPIETTQLLCSC